MRLHYLVADADETVAGEIEKLLWLENQGAITDDEFAELKQRAIDVQEGSTEPPQLLN